MQNRTPRYRYGLSPASDRDDCALSISIRRVDGDPDGGPPGLRTSSSGIDLDALLSDLRVMIAALAAEDELVTIGVRPVHTWVFDSARGPLLMKGPPV